MCVCVLEKERGEDTTNTLNTQTRTPHAHAHTLSLFPSTRRTSQEVRRAVGNMGCTANDAGPRRETSHTALLGVRQTSVFLSKVRNEYITALQHTHTRTHAVVEVGLGQVLCSGRRGCNAVVRDARRQTRQAPSQNVKTHPHHGFQPRPPVMELEVEPEST